MVIGKQGRLILLHYLVIELSRLDKKKAFA